MAESLYSLVTYYDSVDIDELGKPGLVIGGAGSIGQAVTKEILGATPGPRTW